MQFTLFIKVITRTDVSRIPNANSPRYQIVGQRLTPLDVHLEFIAFASYTLLWSAFCISEKTIQAVTNKTFNVFDSNIIYSLGTHKDLVNVWLKPMT